MAEAKDPDRFVDDPRYQHLPVALRENMGKSLVRTKRQTFDVILNRILDEDLQGTGQSKREALVRVFVNGMLRSNEGMIREYLRREWPAIDHLALSSASDTEAMRARQAALPAEVREKLGALGREAVRRMPVVLETTLVEGGQDAVREAEEEEGPAPEAEAGGPEA